MPSRVDNARRNPVRDALVSCRTHFTAIAVFSAVSNVLGLVPSIYMMQVYDRVIPTGGLVTLVALSLVGLFAIAIMSALDWLRARLLVRVGVQIEAALGGYTLNVIMSQPRLRRTERAEAMRDLDMFKQGISSPIIAALFDIPWAPVYIVVAFLLHWALGALTLAAAIVMLFLAWDNERTMRTPMLAATSAATATYVRQVQITDHAGEVRALGMGAALTTRQLGERSYAAVLQTKASFGGGNHSNLLRFLRVVLQSGALGLGALLVVEGKVSGGAVFASSLLLTRALSPIDQVVAAWKSILQTRNAYDKISALLLVDTNFNLTNLPVPTGDLQVEHITVLAPETERVALADVSFTVKQGEMVSVIGPSGAGKSTLLKALAGAELPARGHVRFDHASSIDWDQEKLARHIGYLPQNFILFPGTVKDNIARFRGYLSSDQVEIDEKVVAAAQMVGIHETILRLPQGYDTVIGASGGVSSGQAQRIALARAFFDAPRYIMLDEPSAHLDSEGQQYLMRALQSLRGAGMTILFSTHSSEMAGIADKVLVLRNGRVDRFGRLADIAVEASAPLAHTPGA